MSDINEWIGSLVAELKASVLRHGRQAMSVFGSKADVVRTYGECRLMTAGSTGHCNTARSLSAGVSKPKVFRGR
jgi:hypothetical protein